MTLHSFRESLASSHQAEDLECWQEIYQKAFPTMLRAVCVREDGEHQRAGIDRVIVLASGKTVLVDEKVRYIEYPGDLLLEFISNDATGAPGWIEKHLLADYIAMAYYYTGQAFFLPVIQTQAAWKANREEWIRKYRLPPAMNRMGRDKRYGTHSCAVPEWELFSAINECFRVSFQVT